MAKMFYTLDEAAQRLGVDIEKVKEMAASGDIQQFRDRDKLMFKRDQIDTLAGGSGDSDSGSPIPLVPNDDTDAISLADTNMASKPGLTSTGTGTAAGTGSGMSVFGPDEVEPVDPMAQTAVTNPMADTAQEDLSLESVGSGSGLLDLTRESDDTSLGAELLDEIYPGGTNAGEGSLASGIGSSGVFESAISMETGAGGTAAGGLTDLQGGAAPAMGGAGGVGGAMIATYDSGVDAAGSGFGAGMLLGATISLIIALIVAVSAVLDVQSAITGMMTSSGMNYGIWCVGLLVASVIFGVVGMMIGKAGAS
jgi:excisionase family DNA binding protein